MSNVVTGKWALAALLAVLVTRSDAVAAQPDPLIDGFVKACQGNKDIDDATRQKALDRVKEVRADADRRQMAITEGLREIYPEFRAALVALGNEETEKAAEGLTKLAESKDRFLASEATFFLARSYMINEQYEEAMPLLAKLTSDKTLYSSDALFLLGVAQAGVLDRKKAIASLEKFVDANPNAPERMIVGALTRLEELKFTQEGSLVDVGDHMEFSRRKLSLEDSGDQTRGEQGDIIAMLDKLIEEAENQGGS